ncbi:hypothetical protein BH18ACT3_BH18ACT3_01320 [soil metagenome]
MSSVLTGRRRPWARDVEDQHEVERSVRWSSSDLAERVALVAALAPIVVAVVRAALTGWMPLFDAGYFMVRSRDVFTEHHPLLGAWSMGSRAIGTSLNNVGPMQLDLLAPFTKVFSYWGTALGTGLINGGAVIGVWAVARRLFGSRGAVGAMIATLCLEATMASWMLIEARQQLALLLPLWCLLWLTAAMWTGAVWSLPWTVFVASLIAQTHFSFVYQAAAVVLAGSVGFVLAARSGGRPPRLWRAIAVSSVVGFVCWAQTLWDQFFGTGNLLRVLAKGGTGAEAVGFSSGAQYVAGSTLAPPFWTPGYMGRYLRPADDIISARAAWFTMVVWLVVLAAVTMIGRRLGRPPVVAMGVIGASVLTAAVYAAAKIPTTEFGIVAYNYYWMWPIGVFVTTAAVAGVLSLPLLRMSLRSSAAVLVGAVGCVVLALPVLRPVNYLPETADEADAGARVGDPLLTQFADSLERLDVTGPLVIDRTRETHTNYFPYTMLTELQRAGIEFTFPADDVSRDRFGRSRCEDGRSPHRLILADGEASLKPAFGETVLAQVNGMTDAEQADLAELQAEFGERIRDGTVFVDLSGIRYFDSVPDPTLLRVLEEESEAPAEGLARYLANWRVFDVVTVPDELEPDFRRWRVLEDRLTFDRVAIFLGPNLITPTDACETVEPGVVPIGE